MAKRSKLSFEKQLKKVHKTTLIFVIIFALIGVIGGIGTCYYFTKDDVFKINGEEKITLTIGDTYTEQGCTIIAFGKNISDQVIISGEVDTQVSGKYVLKYTVNNFRYAGYTLYKLITVQEVGA